MGTWLKRSTSKKYVLYHEHESMDQILAGLLESQQPEKIKEAIITRICEQGSQPSQPASSVRGVLQVSCNWILHGTSTLQVASGFKLLNSWGTHNLECFQSFFTPTMVADLLGPNSGMDANVPLLIREGLRVMNHVGTRLYYEHAQMVQSGITKFVCGTSERQVVRNVGLLLGEFNECIPTAENELTNFCIAVLHHLSIGVPPQNGREILKFIKLTDEIAAFLSTVWKLQPANLLGDCLAEIFRIISATTEVDSEPAICLASVVKHIPIELANRVVKDVVTDPTISEDSIKAAVGQIVEWLKWPTAQNVDLWLSCFLTELAAAHKYTLLVRITEANTEQVVENITYPQLRRASFKILSQMLLSFQHSPGPFHKALEKIPPIITSMRQEGTSHCEAWLVQLASLIHCLMYLHTGFPEIYDPVLEIIKDLPQPSVEEIKTQLQQTKWSSQVSGCEITPETPVPSPATTIVKQEKLETGKTGLDNLGNTCYMNSVIQALYMCDQFRRGVLSKSPTGQESLLVKLQHVFAMLSHSNRPMIAPSKFLQASRPPWFLPGHQQDCSEFLKYLLDQLHEDEKSGNGFLKRSLSSGSESSTSPTGTIRLNKGSLSKKDKKVAVMLTGVKMKTEEEMNGFNSHGGSCNAENDLCSNALPSLVEKTFRGKVQTTMRCLACRQESKRTETFSDIPLAFPNSSRSTEYPNKILAGGSSSTAAESSSTPAEGEQVITKASEDCLTLNDLISFYLKPEKLTGDNKYHCDHCGKLQDGERSIQIMESPQYLILTLLRFSYDTKLQTRTKIFQDVCYPRTLAIPVCDSTSSSSSASSSSSSKDAKSSPSKRHSQYTSSIQINGNGNGKEKSIIIKDTHQRTKLESIATSLAPKCESTGKTSQHCDLYGLTGVIVHSGTSSECGHYYCYARHSQAGQVDPRQVDKVNGNLEKLDLLPDKWYNFNDSRVSHAAFDSFSNVTKRFSKDTAYVLIYRKLDLGSHDAALYADQALRTDLREAVLQDNEAYLQEQEIDARAQEEQRRRSASVSSASLRNWRDTDDDDDNRPGGPPGCGGGFGGGLDTSGSRFVF